MGKEQMYRQCKMQKKVDNGTLVHTAWIPSSFAKVGKNISLLQNPDKPEEYWDHGWVVLEAGGSMKTHEDMDVQRKAQKRWESVLK